MDKDIIDILQRLQKEGEERMKKNIFARDIDNSTPYVSNKEKLIIHTYNRVVRENIAAKAVYKTVDYIHGIYSNLTQEEIDKLFNDLFYATTNLLDTLDNK